MLEERWRLGDALNPGPMRGLQAAGNCVGDASNATGPYLNSTSTPGSPALFATFVRMADVEVMEGSAAAFHSLQAAACAIALAGVFSFAALIQ